LLWLRLNDLRLLRRWWCCLCLRGCGRAGGQRGQELAHAGVVLGDALLELELKAGLLGHPLIELSTAVADHVADHDADEEAAEHRGEAVVRRDRPGGVEGAERHRADGRAGRRTDRDAEPAHSTRLRLIVGDKLAHCPLRLSPVRTHATLIGVRHATLEKDGQIAQC
jgi:hypothetical protein